jgi:hypothetical protein
LGFRLLVDHVPQEAGKRDFFSGIPLSPGVEARRMLREAPEQTVDAVRRSSQARRNLNAILANVDRQNQSDERYLAEVTDLVRTMEGGHAAEVLLQLAKRYHERGQWELAAETYDAVVDRYPKHPAAGAALVWLIQYYASGEAMWRISQKQQRASATRESSDLPHGTRMDESELRAQSRNVRQASAVLDFSGNQATRPSRATGYAKQLEQLSPSLFAEPEVRFPLAAANRSQGFPRQAERFLLGFVRNRPRDAWHEAAQSELSLLTRNQSPTGVDQTANAEIALRPQYQCIRAPGKPRLDGILDDSVWRVAKRAELKSALHDDGEWPAIVMLAHDDQFLYLAASCREASGVSYKPANRTRPRDADLSAHDRIELYVDIDRDYATAFRFVIDSRGWTHDSCWQDSSWNPKWYVASTQANDVSTSPTWTAEAAISLAELNGPMQPRDAWVIGLQRVVPNVGFQSWNRPAAVEVQPEGFGVIQFD